jgi:hypothetical protein
MYQVFLSYSSGNRPLVQTLSRELERRRLRVFLDVDSVRAGQSWPPQLGSAIQSSRVMVLCWSVDAAASEWVRAEIHHCLSSRKQVPVLPWLLDDTPLPAMISQCQGIKGNDPAPVVRAIAERRKLLRRRQLLRSAVGTLILLPAAWWATHFAPGERLIFRGHVVDQQGNPVKDADVEAAGNRVKTHSDGSFVIRLADRPQKALRVLVSGDGFPARTLDTQADVPDLGIVVEKEK